MTAFAPALPPPTPAALVTHVRKGHPSRGRAIVPADPATSYLYVASGQVSSGTTGAGAMLVQSDPALAAGDFHSLAELSVESADEQQIVEVGWTVDPETNGDEQPRLFVFHWIDGVATCYDACGWVQVSTTRMPGMRVDVGTTQAFEIALQNGDWWVSYQGEQIGYFPGSLWNGTFTATGFTQWFGEIAAASDTSCTQMGDGMAGSATGATRFSGAYLIAADGTQQATALGSAVTITDAASYSMGQLAADAFSFGGPGTLGASCCTPTTCTAAAAACGDPADTCGSELDCGACDDGATCASDFACQPVMAAEGDAPSSGGGGGCCESGGDGYDGRGVVPLAVIVASGLAMAGARRRRTRASTIG